MSKADALPLPPAANEDRGSREALRVWALSSGGQQFVAAQTWKDPAAWGLLAIDLLKHAARIYEQESGISAKDAYARMLAGFDAERAVATDAGMNLDTH